MNRCWAGYVAKTDGCFVTYDGYLSEDPGDAYFHDDRASARMFADESGYRDAVIVMAEYEISYQEFP